MFLSKHIIVSVITEAYNLSYFCVWYEARVEIHSFASCVCVLVAWSCLTLCDPMDCSLPGFSIHGILQERILKWVA